MKNNRTTSIAFTVLTVLLLSSFAIIAYLSHHQTTLRTVLEEELAALRKEGNTVVSHDLTKTLQDQLQAINATHLIRKYHQHLALFDVKELLKDQMVINVTETMAGSTLTPPPSFHFEAPNFKWERIDNARPLDVVRLTFRGNGIPEDAEKLAKSELLEPKLRAFYQSLMEPNTTVWKSSQTIHFQLRTHNGDTYEATSTPFISIQPISKNEYARMKSAALPFLWQAYEKNNLTNKPDNKPTLVDTAHTTTSPPLIRQAEDIADISQLDTSKQTEPLQTHTTSISGVTLDPSTIQSLYYQKVLENTHDPQKAQELKNIIIAQAGSLGHHQHSKQTGRYLTRLANYDPEFSSLFLIDNLFEQYNLFSVFDENVTLRVNAIDTKLNLTYVSYNTRFDTVDDLTEASFKMQDVNTSFSCNDTQSLNISDEFFLIITDSQAYLMRVYLPDCYLIEEDYKVIDNFLNDIHILNDSAISNWGTKHASSR